MRGSAGRCTTTVASRRQTGAEARESARSVYFELLRQLQGAVRAVLLSATASNTCVRCSDLLCEQLFQLIRSCFLAGCRRFTGAASGDFQLLLVCPEFALCFARDVDFIAYLCTINGVASFAREFFVDEARLNHFYIEIAIMHDEELHLAFVSSLLALEPVGFRPDHPQLAKQCLAASLADLRLIPVSWGGSMTSLHPASRSGAASSARPATVIPPSDLAGLAERAAGYGAGLFRGFLRSRPARASVSDAAATGDTSGCALVSKAAGDCGYSSDSLLPMSECPASSCALDVGADTTDAEECFCEPAMPDNADVAEDTVVGGAFDKQSQAPSMRRDEAVSVRRDALIRPVALSSTENCIVLEDASDTFTLSEFKPVAANMEEMQRSEAETIASMMAVNHAASVEASDKARGRYVPSATLFAEEVGDAFGLETDCAADLAGGCMFEVALSLRDLGDLGVLATTLSGRRHRSLPPERCAVSWHRKVVLTPDVPCDLSIDALYSSAGGASSSTNGVVSGRGQAVGVDCFGEEDDVVLALESLWESSRAEGARQLLRSVGGCGGGVADFARAGHRGAPLRSLALALSGHLQLQQQAGFAAKVGSGDSPPSSPRGSGSGKGCFFLEDGVSECDSEDSSCVRSRSSSSTAQVPDAMNGANGLLKLDWRLNLRPRPAQAAQISLQRGHCQGCREKLPTPLPASAFGSFAGPRFCHYLGLYFCRSCHHGSRRPIPARVAECWDFEPRGVCVLAARYLDTQAYQPLIPISQIRRTRASSQGALTVLHRHRRQLAKLKELAERSGCQFLRFMLNSELPHLAGHFASEPELYSLMDLLQLHLDGSAAACYVSLARLVTVALDHVEACEACDPDGGHCPICASGQQISALDVDSYHACTDCGQAYHRLCWMRSGGACPRCLSGAPCGALRVPSIAAVRPR